MNSISISIDVPNLEEGVRFYTEAFGFTKVAAPVPGVVVLMGGGTSHCLLEKAEGSTPTPGSPERRRYARHWTPVTPVHLDINVDD